MRLPEPSEAPRVRPVPRCVPERAFNNYVPTAIQSIEETRGPWVAVTHWKKEYEWGSLFGKSLVKIVENSLITWMISERIWLIGFLGIFLALKIFTWVPHFLLEVLSKNIRGLGMKPVHLLTYIHGDSFMSYKSHIQIALKRSSLSIYVGCKHSTSGVACSSVISS